MKFDSTESAIADIRNGRMAILVDDELNSLQNLQFKIQEYCPSIKVLAQTQHPEEAIRLIQQNKPDVIFLDIEMPIMDGKETVAKLGADAAMVLEALSKTLQAELGAKEFVIVPAGSVLPGWYSCESVEFRTVFLSFANAAARC